MAVKMKRKFRCDDCGKYFDWPRESEEVIGEYWGIPATETEYTCPYCDSPFFEELKEED